MAVRQTELEKVANELSYRDYYSTVAYGYIIAAIEDAVDEHGSFKSIDELDEYIRENLI